MNMVVSPYSDAYGRKRFHLLGLFIFAGASIGCGFAQNITQLIGFRLLQAFGASAPAIVGMGHLFFLSFFSFFFFFFFFCPP